MVRPRSLTVLVTQHGADLPAVIATVRSVVASGVAVTQAEYSDADFDLTPTRHGPA